MVLKSYFDGGHSANRDRITLAMACGTCEEWDDAESNWRKVLSDHKAPFLHTTNAVCLQKEFSKDKGWNGDKVNAFISDCVNVIEHCLLEPGRVLISDQSGLVANIARPGLNVVTMTIPFDDFRRARKVNLKLPSSITELCASESLGFVFRYGRRIGIQKYQLYFDQGEPFYGHISDRHRNRKTRKDVGLLNNVVHLGQSDMRVSPALQIADLFAWCINHNDDVRREWHERLGRLPWDSAILDYKHLLNPTPGALERTAAWGLPKRKPTK